jgi:hypothetical protein
MYIPDIKEHPDAEDAGNVIRRLLGITVPALTCRAPDSARGETLSEERRGGAAEADGGGAEAGLDLDLDFDAEAGVERAGTLLPRTLAPEAAAAEHFTDADTDFGGAEAEAEAEAEADLELAGGGGSRKRVCVWRKWIDVSWKVMFPQSLRNVGGV